jgi:class 3 adenylate cyclase
MAGATIVVSDIVGFSQKPTHEQGRLVEGLTVELLQVTRLLLNPPLRNPSAIALPTGDGAAIAFLDDAPRDWDLDTIFRLISRIQQWALHENIKLRIGVHAGAVELITDINGKPNICGDAINYAQRVMDAANDGQVLFSDAAHRHYVRKSSERRSAAFPGTTISFKGPSDVFAKHGLRIPVFNMLLEPKPEYWSNEDPLAKHLMLVALTTLPKEVDVFAPRLDNAKQIALVQLTGERLLPKLKEGIPPLTQDLRRFWVFMPDPKAYEHLMVPTELATPEQVHLWVEEWRAFLIGLREKQRAADIKLGLFAEPPYFGASFLNWEQTGGVIHVSPYVWGLPTPKSPGYDLKWIGQDRSTVYEAYVRGLEYLNARTKNAIYEP